VSAFEASGAPAANTRVATGFVDDSGKNLFPIDTH